MGEAKRQWDMSTQSGMQSGVDWLRKKSEALLVVAIRVDDLGIAADPQLAPREVLNLFEDRLEELHAKLQAQRTERLARQDRQREKGKR